MGASSSVARTAPGKRIAKPDHQMACPSHVAGYQNRLSCLFENRGKFFCAGPISTCGPFTMDAQSLWFAIDFVHFEFCDVVADIVNKRDVLRMDMEDVLKSLSYFVQNLLSIVKREVGRCSH